MSKHFIFLFIYLIFVVSCSNDKSKVDTILLQQDVEEEMVLAYKEGMKQLELGMHFMHQENLMRQKFCFPNLSGLPKHH